MKEEIKSEFESRLVRVEEGTTQVVTFGVYLVASALLAGALGAILAILSATDTETGLASLNVAVRGNWLNPLLWLFILLSAFLLIIILVTICRLAHAIKIPFWSSTH